MRPTVIETISPNDWMWKGHPDKVAYLNAGWTVGRTVRSALSLAEFVPNRILDFGCGHGRMLRWFRALYPTANIVACDRETDGVDFCSQTFNAMPVYSTDTLDDLEIGDDFDLIWLGSVYTHLPMDMWVKLTNTLTSTLSKRGILAFSFAGPHVANLLFEGERNPNAEIAEEQFDEFRQEYETTGFAYARHKGLTNREWGRSIVSHTKMLHFLKELDLSILIFGERLYCNRQDIVCVRPNKNRPFGK